MEQLNKKQLAQIKQQLLLVDDQYHEMVLTSDEVLSAEDLYWLQETFSSHGCPFHYIMSPGELEWLEFVKGRYSIYDWVLDNLTFIDLDDEERALLRFDCPESMSKALDDDCPGFGKAVCLSDETALQKLFFWLYVGEV